MKDHAMKPEKKLARKEIQFLFLFHFFCQRRSLPFYDCNWSTRPTHSHMLSVRPSVQNLAKQNKCQAKTMFTTGETVGLAKWIIDDTSLVLFFCQSSCFFLFSLGPKNLIEKKLTILISLDLAPMTTRTDKAELASSSNGCIWIYKTRHDKSSNFSEWQKFEFFRQIVM